MANAFNFQAESRLTDRYQTTIPQNVRTTLGLTKGDKIHYTMESNGQVTMSRVEEEEDPVIGNFLNFLAQDMSKNPQNIKPITSDLFNRMKSLTDGIEVDLDAPLSEEDE